MSCEQHQSALLDLASGDPPSVDLAGVRAHVASCAACSAALTRIRSGLALSQALVLAEPPSDLSERILAQARAHAASASRKQESLPVELAPQPSLFERLREFLSQLVMSRQAAMATVVVLVTAVGLWFVPNARHRELASGNVVNPDPDGEAGPSSGIAPAAPLDLDLRQGRIRARGDEPPTARARAATTTETANGIAQVVAKESPAATREEATADTVEATLALAEDSSEHKRSHADTEVSVATSTANESSRLGGSVEAALREEPTLSPKDPSAPRAQLHEAEALGAAHVPTPSRVQREADDARTYAFAPPPAPARAAPAGGGPAAAPSAESAIAPPAEERTGGEPLKGADVLGVARTLKRSGQCERAVVQYEAFLRTSPRNREVMLEAASCYRQLGRNADANRWVARANAISVALKGDALKSAPTPASTDAQ